jgi:hypothetical protein
MNNGPQVVDAAAHSQTRGNGDQASSDQLAIMHALSIATGLMAHRCPPPLAVFSHELPGYLGYLLFGAKLGYVAAAIPATGAAP